MAIRFLHLADTHLGARHPARGGGDPYLRSFRRALAPARRGEVDLVLHGGDMYARSRPSVRRVAEGSGLLLDAAEGGARVVLVAGNHETSVLPGRLLLGHPRIHVLEAASRLSLEIGGARVSIYGFPFLRREPRARFASVLSEAGWPRGRGDVNVLLCHQTFEGARVGPVGYTFRAGPEVIPLSAVPAGFHYGALGHIHRRQLLRHPARPGLLLAYPGATERTARAEGNEEKGYLRGEFRGDGTVRVRFIRLPVRPLSREWVSRPG